MHACCALIGALLLTASAQAATIVPDWPAHPTARPAPPPAGKTPTVAAKRAPAPFYDYRAAAPVSEHFIRTDAKFARDENWRTGRRDAYRQDHRGHHRHAGARHEVDLDQQGFNGGVGYGMDGGGGYGGQSFLYMGQGGGSAEPSNRGGVSLPPGYGPTYRGVWQGPVSPTRGGLSTGRH